MRSKKEHSREIVLFLVVDDGSMTSIESASVHLTIDCSEDRLQSSLNHMILGPFFFILSFFLSHSLTHSVLRRDNVD